MHTRIRTGEDLAWLIDHTGGFRGGQVLDLHVRKERVFDEGSGRDVTVGTVVTVSIRYDRRATAMPSAPCLTRVTRLTMLGVTDFSVFEQEGTDFSALEEVHGEAAEGRLRFWFDPCGELYIVCEEAVVEEVVQPRLPRSLPLGVTEWTFNADRDDLPCVTWFLEQLDRAGFPCAWRPVRGGQRASAPNRWEGHFVPVDERERAAGAGIHAIGFGTAEGGGFGLTIRIPQMQGPETGRLLLALADAVARNFPGTCLAGDQVLRRDEWLSGRRPGSSLEEESSWDQGAEPRSEEIS